MMTHPVNHKSQSAPPDNIGRSTGQHSPARRTVAPSTVRQSGLIVTKTTLSQSAPPDTSNIPVGGGRPGVCENDIDDHLPGGDDAPVLADRETTRGPR